MSKDKEPKVIPSFDGCYNYSKLKKEGLVDNKETEVYWSSKALDQLEDLNAGIDKEYTPENDPFGGY